MSANVVGTEGTGVGDARWRRRALTLPAYWLGTALLLILFIPLLTICACLDLATRGRTTCARAVCFAMWYFACECWGMLVALWLWLKRFLTAPTREQYESWHYDLQRRWARALMHGMRTLFRVQVDVVQDDADNIGPYLVFMRHASLLDALLPANLLTHPYGLRLRYVLKRELLADPCLDIVGLRLPNVFVRRGSNDSAREIALVAALGRDLSPGEGVLIYPEGTRFTPTKQARILGKLAHDSDAARYERVRGLRHVLPARLGGPLALLDAASTADVLIVAHAGLDGIAEVREVFNGGLLDRRIVVRIRRIPRAAIPRDQDERVRWLDAQWSDVDDWVNAALSNNQAGGS